MSLEQALNRAWYAHSPGFLWLLLPVEIIFRGLVAIRRRLIKPLSCGAPVVVVGNISVGGSGKTPVVLAVAQALKAAGYQPGIISRGYGGKADYYPFLVDENSTPEQVGDEPCLLFQRCGLPVAVAPDRVAAGRFLVEQHGCDVIVSDDGLQHYRLARKLEILVVDGQRGFGNQHCLPVGPLREPCKRAQQVDFCISNGVPQWSPDTSVYSMTLRAGRFVNLLTAESRRREDWPAQQKQINALAGIGNPQRFFSSLEAMGFSLTARPLPDHHPITEVDLDFSNPEPIIMTEKDAVKCRDIAGEQCWMLPVEADLPPEFYTRLLERLRA